VKTSEKNVHGGNIFYPFCDMGENFTPWGWGTQNLCAKTGTDSGAGSCVNFRKSQPAFSICNLFFKMQPAL
jgi:hypothetical protein